MVSEISLQLNSHFANDRRLLMTALCCLRSLIPLKEAARSELFTLILCGPYFAVSWRRKLIFTSKLPLPLESPPIKFEISTLSKSDVINVWIFERAKNHGKKFLKLSQTSVSVIVNWKVTRANGKTPEESAGPSGGFIDLIPISSCIATKWLIHNGGYIQRPF